MNTVRVLVVGAAGGTLIAAMLSNDPQTAATDGPEIVPPAAPVAQGWDESAARAVTSAERAEPSDAGDPIAPPVTLDALLDELEADSAPGFAEIDRDAFKSELLADPVLRDFFSRAR